MPTLALSPTVTNQQRSFTGASFETFLYDWVQYIRNEQAFSLDLVQASVTMHVRARSVTISDMVSNFGVVPGGQGNGSAVWMQYDPTLDGEVHPLNIVGPAIATNKSACLQSNAAVEVESSNQNASHKQIAVRWQRVCDFFERTGWNEAKRGYIFDATQKDGTTLIDSYCEHIGNAKASTLTDGTTSLVMFNCEKCGVKITESAEDVEVCPQCQSPVEASKIAMDGMQTVEQDVPRYEIKDRTIPFFNFTIDTFGAKVGGIKSALWLQVQELRDRNYMDTRYPGRQFGSATRWSYPLQCSYALARGRWQWLNSMPSVWFPGHERYEERSIFLHEDAYSAYRSPDDYQFVNAFGKVTFNIKQGESIGEAQARLYGENQHGFKFVWTDENLLTICPPDGEELNFRDRFSDVHWSRESGSYLSSPNYSIVYIQDDITLLNTLHHNIIARNAVNPILYDSLAFEEADFSKEFVGTKNRAYEPDFDIKKVAMSLPIPTPSPYLSQQIQFLWNIKDSVSMVTPAMRGEAQGNSPYAAQRQQLEQSYGNLTPVLKSFAQCKVETFRNKAKLAKKVWTREDFERVASMFDEHWSESDIEEMCAIDFDRDLIIMYREGTEMPASPLSKELKMFNALSQLGQVIAGLPPEMALEIVGIDKWQHIVDQIGDLGDMDFDLADIEIDNIISQKRYKALSDACMPFEGITTRELDMWKQQVVTEIPPTPEAIQQSIQVAQSAPDDPQVQAEAQQLVTPTPITRFDVETEQIFKAVDIRFNQYEDLQDQREFFIGQYRAEIGKNEPNQMLAAMLEVLLGQLDQVIGEMNAQAQQEAVANDPQAQAMAAQAENERAKLELEAAKTASESEIAQGKLELEGQRLEVDAIAQERKDMVDITKADREHQRNIVNDDAKREADKEKAKEKPKVKSK